MWSIEKCQQQCTVDVYFYRQYQQPLKYSRSEGSHIYEVSPAGIVYIYGPLSEFYDRHARLQKLSKQTVARLIRFHPLKIRARVSGAVINARGCSSKTHVDVDLRNEPATLPYFLKIRQKCLFLAKSSSTLFLIVKLVVSQRLSTMWYENRS